MTVLIVGVALLIVVLAALAYRLAVHALPVMLAIAAVRFAYATGAGPIGAGCVGVIAALVSFGLLAALFATLRAPTLSWRWCSPSPPSPRAMRSCRASPSRSCHPNSGGTSSQSPVASQPVLRRRHA
jgi:hypothetical protein